jgi:3D (Asp-Asp-Asp) domain-containing protein
MSRQRKLNRAFKNLCKNCRYQNEINCDDTCKDYQKLLIKSNRNLYIISGFVVFLTLLFVISIVLITESQAVTLYKHNVSEVTIKDSSQNEVSFVNIERPKPPPLPKTPSKVIPAKDVQVLNNSVSSESFIATYYTKNDAGMNGLGITASGTKATAGRTIAVDPRFIPFGTHVLIDGKEYICEDSGGDIKNNRIDIYVDSVEEALSKGRHKVSVVILP